MLRHTAVVGRAGTCRALRPGAPFVRRSGFKYHRSHNGFFCVSPLLCCRFGRVVSGFTYETHVSVSRALSRDEMHPRDIPSTDQVLGLVRNHGFSCLILLCLRTTEITWSFRKQHVHSVAQVASSLGDTFAERAWGFLRLNFISVLSYDWNDIRRRHREMFCGNGFGDV